MIDEFDYTKFRIERRVSGAWKEVPAATFTYGNSVEPDEKGTLIYGIETGTISVVRYGVNLSQPWNPGDRIRARYDQSIVMDGIVDTVKVNRSVGKQPKTWRYEFVCTMVGRYALAMSKVVCWPDLPKESAYKRLSRFVTIVNLVYSEAESESEIT